VVVTALVVVLQVALVVVVLPHQILVEPLLVVELVQLDKDFLAVILLTPATFMVVAVVVLPLLV
jgi:hypothetical protein